MRHQPQNVAIGVADAGDVIDGAVGVPGVAGVVSVSVDISEDYLVVRFHDFEDFGTTFLGYEEFALGVGARHFQNAPAWNFPREDALALIFMLQERRAALETSGVVYRERRTLACDAGEQAELHEHLEAVTDSEDGTPLLDEGLKLLKVAEYSGCEDGARTHVVAGGEAARDDEAVVIEEVAAVFLTDGAGELFEVHDFRDGAEPLKAERRLPLAVRAFDAEDANFTHPFLFLSSLLINLQRPLTTCVKMVFMEDKLKFRMRVSIVIPTYNEENVIIQKLENTLALDYPKEDLEIIISDCSTDRTVERIKEYFRGERGVKLILYHEDERRGLPYGLNKGYALASGEIVVKTDCDAMLHREALKHAIKSFEDERVGCVTGRAVPIGSAHEKSYRAINTKIQLWESKIDSTIIAHGPFTAFRKKLFVPIDEDSLADDSEISLKIRRQGYKSILNPDVLYYERVSMKGREDQKVRRASGLIRLLWRNKDILFNPKYGKFGLIVFPFNFFVIILLPVLLSPILLMLMVLGIRGGVLLETQKFLLKGICELLRKRATVYWEPDKEIRDWQVSK
ncbi:MAG: Glycosyltransferase [Candidatus Alkanophagales archaeon MCA70_species_2]|nr:Glycosyltransferase [Candidatus Alkanophaga liquidiphilum]